MTRAGAGRDAAHAMPRAAPDVRSEGGMVPTPMPPSRRPDQSDRVYDPAVADATRRADALERVRAIARLMDNAVRVPGTNIGIGLDALIGVIPGFGDLAGGAVSAWVLMNAARAGVPRTVLVRMLLNLGIDAVVGAVPVLGDLFDIGFKANVRNARLLEQALAQPTETRRSSALVVVGVVVGALAIAAAGVALAILVVRAIWTAANG